LLACAGRGARTPIARLATMAATGNLMLFFMFHYWRGLAFPAVGPLSLFFSLI
jgi:hypothetical protein